MLHLISLISLDFELRDNHSTADTHILVMENRPFPSSSKLNHLRQYCPSGKHEFTYATY